MINKQRLDLCKSVSNYEKELVIKKELAHAEKGKAIAGMMASIALLALVDACTKRKKRWYEF